MKISYEKFIASKVIQKYSELTVEGWEYLEDEMDDDTPVHVYLDSYVIFEDTKRNVYWTVIGNSNPESEALMVVERQLYLYVKNHC